MKHLCIVDNQKSKFEAEHTTDKDETSVHSFKTHLGQTGWTGLFEIWKYNWFELHFGLDVLPTLYYHHQTGKNLDLAGVNWSWADKFKEFEHVPHFKSLLPLLCWVLSTSLSHGTAVALSSLTRTRTGSNKLFQIVCKIT